MTHNPKTAPHRQKSLAMVVSINQHGKATTETAAMPFSAATKWIHDNKMYFAGKKLNAVYFNNPKYSKP